MSIPLNDRTVSISRLVLLPEDGLLLGNGDLSVSVYQTADEIRWRFGKGDVWDRRIDISRDPKPAHIDEVRRGILEEGWRCDPYGGAVEATRGSADAARMLEICQGTPPSHNEFPYPTPKPVGELAMRLPVDGRDFAIEQSLDLLTGEVSISCRWRGGVMLTLVCFVAGTDNVLCVNWKLTGWSPATRYGGDFPGVGPAQPIWFRLYRWRDSDPREAADQFFMQHRHPGLRTLAGPTATPLPPPTVRQRDGLWAIDQAFYPDSVFPNGFHCLLSPVLFSDGEIENIGTGALQTAMLHWVPKSLEGFISVGVATGSEGDSFHQLAKLRVGSSETWQAAGRRCAEQFWSKSSVAIGESTLSRLWHTSLHARRCTFRSDTVPPGLFLPSTIGDYSIWHGDYHTNYNFQSIFLGDYAANHVDLGDAYFKAMEFFLPIGRKIAKDYYGCRGAFIQLSGFPTHPEDDPLGCVPMGRMAYMTGWAGNMYWWRYQYTRDKEWLTRVGYPALREFALFYTDFLGRGTDGQFHAFPSNQGEDGFTGNPADFTDRPQILRHARYCLECARQAAEVIGADPELRAAWSDIVNHLPVDPALRFDRNGHMLPPEFIAFDGGASDSSIDGPAFLKPDHDSYHWYPGKLPYHLLIAMRNGAFDPERDFSSTVALLNRWTHDNGLLWAMAIANYGHWGAWTESLGVIAPIQEMLLSDWGGVIRFFPGLPKAIDAEFSDLLTASGMRISAKRIDGEVVAAKIIPAANAILTMICPIRQSLIEMKVSSGTPMVLKNGCFCEE